MFDFDKRLEAILARHARLEQELSQPLPAEELIEKNKQLHALSPYVGLWKTLQQLRADCAQAQTWLDDPEYAEWAAEELPILNERLAACEQAIIEKLLLTNDDDHRNVIVEFRAGTGGNEAALFARDLLRMVLRYAERKQWRSEIIALNENEIGGCKEAIVSIIGENVYSRLKFESGVHRVQRVPETEASGRIHTSAATIAVLPSVEAVEIDLKTSDLRIDTFRSQGAGGQHVNTTDSAVRITHLPTGLVAQCQDEKSQHKNRERAMKVLSARLYEQQQLEQIQQRDSTRKELVKSGDRSDRIRTYNFPQSRVTDHRIGLSVKRIAEIMDGDLDILIDPMISADKVRRLADASDEN